MNKFIEVLGGDGTWHFVNVAQITKVSCEVLKTTRGGGFEALSLLDSTIPATSPVKHLTFVTVHILTASSKGEVRFESESEADIWALTKLGIEDFILRSQTLER